MVGIVSVLDSHEKKSNNNNRPIVAVCSNVAIFSGTINIINVRLDDSAY